MKIDVTEKESKFVIKYLFCFLYFPKIRNSTNISTNNQQIKELQAAYKNRKRFTIRLNGTYVKL